eukprot:133609-Prymnesium_polylepis.1
MRLRLAAHVDVCVRRRPTSNVEPERIETTMHMRKTNDPCCWRSRLACLVEQEGSRSHKLHFFCRRRRLSGPGARASRACLRPSASKDICLPPRGRDEDRKQPTGERGCKVLAVTKREGDEDRVDRDARPVEVYLEPALRRGREGGSENADGSGRWRAARAPDWAGGRLCTRTSRTLAARTMPVAMPAAAPPQCAPYAIVGLYEVVYVAVSRTARPTHATRRGSRRGISAQLSASTASCAERAGRERPWA